ncbi:MAG: NAD-dependent epimerase/dehydratase family protein [FCB group bacterium]|nr:NAD-dependent epimerase/dehydratase family protein [FCB group bacterium]
MKIIVTGGAGFIGSNLTDKLIESGHQVVVIDNLTTGFEKFINPHAKFYLADIRDGAVIDKIFKMEKPDIVDHHAAQIDVRKSVDTPVYDAECNILGSINLIKSSLDHKVKKFIYISTGGAVYGEPQNNPVSETHPVNPECQYGISKHTVEHYLYLYRLHYGLTYTVLRYPNVYGPRQNPQGEAGVNAIFIHQMLSGKTPQIFGDGEQLRDYVFIDDIVSANLIAMEKGDNDIFNIGSCIGTSVNEIYHQLKEILSFPHEPEYAPARTGEINRIYLDASKAKEKMDWECRVSFREGLNKTVEWHRQQID